MKHLTMRQRGMSLIELLVVMTIVGILASIAIPSYRQYTIRTHRATAKACIMEISQFMERFYYSNQTYVGADARLPLPCQTDGDMATRYEFTLTDIEEREFQINATPQAAQDDAKCDVLTLDHTGLRSESGTGSLSDCW